MEHVWQTSPVSAKYILLQGSASSLVRIEPLNGRYIWQFRNVVSYADSVAAAKEYVEAGAEFFDVMRRNPYSQD